MWCAHQPGAPLDTTARGDPRIACEYRVTLDGRPRERWIASEMKATFIARPIGRDRAHRRSIVDISDLKRHRQPHWTASKGLRCAAIRPARRMVYGKSTSATGTTWCGPRFEEMFRLQRRDLSTLAPGLLFFLWPRMHCR